MSSKVLALIRIFGREACRDSRFVAWLTKPGPVHEVTIRVRRVR